MNRLDRLMAISVFLQSRKKVTANDISERFNISLRTVYRDVKALMESGIPICSEAGFGYSIEPGYHLPPLVFTREEATAMLTAGKMIEKFTDSSVDKHYSSAMEKVRSVIRYNDKEYIEILEDRILVFQPPVMNKIEFPNNFLFTIQKAITHKNVIKIGYYSAFSKETTVRKIEPIGLCMYSGRWHMIAFCTLRNDYRDFRVDRIKSVTVMDEPFSKEHPALGDYKPDNYESVDMMKVVVRFPLNLRTELADQKYYYGFIEEIVTENYVEMKFLSNSVDWIGRWLLGFGDKATILEPKEVLDFVITRTKELYSKYH